MENKILIVEDDEMVCRGIVDALQLRNWETCSRNRLPTGIVTPKGGKRIGNVLETQMLLKAKPEYDSVYKDLENSKNFFCKMEENFNQGSLITDNIPYKNFLNNITLLITGAAICILFVTIAHAIDTRKNLYYDWYYRRYHSLPNDSSIF